MTNEEPKIKDEARIGIGAAAQLLGISRETLRNHTNNGHIRCSFHRVSKKRMYLGREIKRYWKAYL
jgi:predicted site-specific integrase-resolvase